MVPWCWIVRWNFDLTPLSGKKIRKRKISCAMCLWKNKQRFQIVDIEIEKRFQITDIETEQRFQIADSETEQRCPITDLDLWSVSVAQFLCPRSGKLLSFHVHDVETLRSFYVHGWETLTRFYSHDLETLLNFQRLVAQEFFCFLLFSATCWLQIKISFTNPILVSWALQQIKF